MSMPISNPEIQVNGQPTWLRRLFLGVLIVVVVLIGYYAYFLWTLPEVSRADFERIQVGMTQAEVEAIIGGPPGEYAGYKPPWHYRSLESPFAVIGTERKKWTGDGGVIYVGFDVDDGKVRWTKFIGWDLFYEWGPKPHQGEGD